jgi:hypothetical protein
MKITITIDWETATAGPTFTTTSEGPLNWPDRHVTAKDVLSVATNNARRWLESEMRDAYCPSLTEPFATSGVIPSGQAVIVGDTDG